MVPNPRYYDTHREARPAAQNRHYSRPHERCENPL